ncbi:hypothetical protein ABZY02_24235 [Streptomyces sp. NPDC006649]|uniref:hypothetical protein n=1 Tax=unclassified Streptomyces TaxID=2593676 RepID=UPI003256001A
MEAGRVGRAVRAAMFAAVSVTLAATGHVLMSETPLPLWAIAAGFLAVAVPSWWAAARERGIWLVAGLAVTTQAILHSAFATVQTLVAPIPARTSPLEVTGSYATGAAGGRMPGMDPTAHMDHVVSMNDMGHTAHMSRAGSMDHMASMGHMGHMGHDMAGMSSSGMLAAHLLAALVCGVWLARGERAAFQILRSVAAWVLAPLQIPLTAPAPPSRPRTWARRGLSDRLPRGLLCTRDLDPRGPPGCLAAV